MRRVANELLEKHVRFVQGFFASDVEPRPLDLMGLDALPLVKPLDKAAWLIRIVPGRDVGCEERHDLAREVVKRDPSEGALRVRGLFLERGDHSRQDDGRGRPLVDVGAGK